MKRLGGFWDAADGMDNKEREEEGNDGFLGEANGKHDLEAWKKGSNIQELRRCLMAGLGVGEAFSFFL